MTSERPHNGLGALQGSTIRMTTMCTEGGGTSFMIFSRRRIG
ncbi:hypothetical protein FHT86_003322 [Rhizobium sp. BK313]|nr:hypothetical protein [Rhizobium sp. BK313]MBB3455023.1 hypothetical protein [Rhizobium sp. BK313]